MIYITAVHMSPQNGTEHSHIAELKWWAPSTGDTGALTRATIVDWINKGGDAQVQDSSGDVQVGVVDANPPYVRTCRPELDQQSPELAPLLS